MRKRIVSPAKRIAVALATGACLLAPATCSPLMAAEVADRAASGATEPAEWTRFRGPNGTGIQPAYSGPLPWKPSDVVARIDLPGSGNGSVAVWGDTAFLQAADVQAKKRSLVAVDLKDHKVLWQAEQPFPMYPIHKFSSYASSTPCVDEQRVYNAWGEPDRVTVEAFTHGGERVWSRDLGSYVSEHGFGTSPMRVGELLILFISQDAIQEKLPPGVEPGTDRMVALRADSGETAWETPLKANMVCYGVPCVTEVNGRTAIVAANTINGFFAIDVADGSLLFEELPFGKRVVSSPALNDRIIVASEGSGGGGNIVVAFDRQAGNRELFRIEKGASYVPTPIVLDDRMLIWSDNGIVSSISLPSGENEWTKRIGGSFSASPILVNGKLLNVNHDGVVTVMQVDPEPEVLASYDLEQGSRASIVATENRILIRTDSQLWVIE